jgi:hypothetical protein
MQIQSRLSAEDYLNYYLFTASTSANIRKKLQNERILLLLLMSIGVVYFYVRGNMFMSVGFGLWAIAGEIWFPQYFRYRYKKHYEKFIRENYAARIGVDSLLEIRDDAIYTRDKFSESKFFLSEVEKVEELPGYFYIKLRIGSHIVLPKKNAVESSDLKNTFHGKGITIVEHPDWRWEKW